MTKYRKHRDSKYLLYAFVVFVFAIVLVLFWADKKLTPQLYALAAAEACAREENALNEAVLSVLDHENTSNLVTIQQNKSGVVTSIQTDALKINLLKSKVLLSAENALRTGSHIISIPSGSLTGLNILSGIGPSFKIPVKTTGYAGADIRSEFESAGINQTIHRLMLNIHADLCLSMAKKQETKSIQYEICIAETVIVGQVPDLYAFHENGE